MRMRRILLSVSFLLLAALGLTGAAALGARFAVGAAVAPVPARPALEAGLWFDWSGHVVAWPSEGEIMPSDVASAALSWSARTVKAGDLTTAFNSAQRNLAWAFGQGDGPNQINLVLHGCVTWSGTWTGITFDLTDFTDVLNRPNRYFDSLRFVYFDVSDDATSGAIVQPSPGTTTLPWATASGSTQALPMGGTFSIVFPLGDGFVIQDGDNSPIRLIGAGAGSRTVEYFFAGIGT